MGQSFDRGGDGRGGHHLPKPTPPPVRNADGKSAPPLPQVSAPPKKISTFPGDSYGPLPRVSSPPSRGLPQVTPPKPKVPPPPNSNTDITHVRADMPPGTIKGNGYLNGDHNHQNGGHQNGYQNGQANGAREPAPSRDLSADALDWTEEEESTSVFGGAGSSEAPPAQQQQNAPPPPNSAMFRGPSSPPGQQIPGQQIPGQQIPGQQMPPSVRPSPRLVPPAPSRATLLGVSPSELGARARSSVPETTSSFPRTVPEPGPGFAPPAIPDLGDDETLAPVRASEFPVPRPPGIPQQMAIPGGVAPSPIRWPAPMVPQPTAPGQSRSDAISPFVHHTSAVTPHPVIPPQMIPTGSGAMPMPVDPHRHDDSAVARLPPGRVGDATEIGTRRQARPPAPSISNIDTGHESSSGKLAVGIALVTALVTAAVAGAFFFLRRPGTLEVDVRDPKGASVPALEVYVDGKKVCEATPCVVRDLEPGARAVRVVAPGFANEEPTSTEVKAGSSSKITISLKPSLSGLIVASTQPGVRVLVDGVDRGTVPAHLTDLAVGTHSLKITGGDRYKTLERTVEMKLGEQVDLGNVKLDVIKGKMTVSVETDDASIVLVPNDDMNHARPLKGPFPKAIEVETNSGTWKLIAKKKGYTDFVSPLDFSDGVAEKTLDVLLMKPDDPDAKDKDKDKDSKDASSTDSKSTDSKTADSKTTPKPGPADNPRTPVDPPPQADPPAGGQGFLNINSIPVSRVLLDGAPMGETPKMSVPVSAGTHTVTFVNPDLGRKSVTVTVKAGETKTAAVKLRD